MRYLSNKDIESMFLNWKLLVNEISKATRIYNNGHFSQPVKPYLRYNNLENRIIAMPAYIGEDIAVAGIKWIASFPGNIHKKIKRAHATIILNEENTGIPFAILNSPLVSGIRTASVTGAVIDKFFKLKGNHFAKPLNVGLTGLGPIGQLHLRMIEDLIGDKVGQYFVYDLIPELVQNVDKALRDKILFVKNWEETFEISDVFCTCTVSKEPYINKKPKPGSLHLNISLRDYKTQFMDYVNLMVVDSWEEVCREKTDIEKMHLEKGLNKEDTLNMPNFLFELDSIGKDDVVMFNPMGMAIYDLAISKYIYNYSKVNNLGVELED